MLENYLIDCCSPTLASLKSGSLFNCRFTDEAGPDSVNEAVANWNSRFEELGIRMYILRKTPRSALIYVYRTTSLARTLKDPEVQTFLSSFGYESCCCCGGCNSADCSIDSCLDHLKSRVSGGTSEAEGDEMSFPHEIGVFLDYPLQDVKGFINNQGRNCKYTGIWKVYGDASEAIQIFRKYEKCNAVYSRLWRSGKRSILQLTVAG